MPRTDSTTRWPAQGRGRSPGAGCRRRLLADRSGVRAPARRRLQRRRRSSAAPTASGHERSRLPRPPGPPARWPPRPAASCTSKGVAALDPRRNPGLRAGWPAAVPVRTARTPRPRCPRRAARRARGGRAAVPPQPTHRRPQRLAVGHRHRRTPTAARSMSSNWRSAPSTSRWPGATADARPASRCRCRTTSPPRRTRWPTPRGAVTAHLNSTHADRLRGCGGGALRPARSGTSWPPRCATRTSTDCR